MLFSRSLPVLLASVQAVYYQWDKERMTSKQIKKDIAELDVGDLDDWESDVTPMFQEMLQEKKVKPLSMQQIQEAEDPVALTLGQQAKIKMVFAVLNHEMMVKEHGDKGGDVMAGRWKGMMQNGGVTVNAYPIGPTRILFTTGGIGVYPELKKFVLDQPETDWFEMDQKKYFPKGRNKPIMDDEDRKKAEIKLGWSDEPTSSTTKKPKKGKSKEEL